MALSPLTREQTVERVVAFEPEIRALGVERLALFGSVLRGDARSDRDVDFLVQLQMTIRLTERATASLPSIR